MKKFIYFILFIITVSVFSGQQNLVFVYNEYPPYEFETESGHTGLSVIQIKKAAKLADLNVQFSCYPWSRAIKMVKKGEADAIFSLFKTNERKQYLDYVETPLSVVKDVIVSLNNSDINIESFEDLKKYSIGVIQDNSHGEKFDNMKELNMDVTISKDILLIKKLMRKRIELIVITKSVFLHLVKTHNLDKDAFKIHPLIINQENLYLAFSKKHKESKILANIFAKKLKKIH